MALRRGGLCRRKEVEKRGVVLFPALQDGGRCAEEGMVWRFAGYQGRGWDGVTDGYGWDGGGRYQGFAGMARVARSFLET